MALICQSNQNGTAPRVQRTSEIKVRQARGWSNKTLTQTSKVHGLSKSFGLAAAICGQLRMGDHIARLHMKLKYTNFDSNVWFIPFWDIITEQVN